MNNTHTNKPWYQERWLWFVLAPLLLVFVVCTILLTTAIKYGDDVVSDDYYKEGRLVNHRFAAESAAVEQGVTAQLTLDKTGKRIQLELNQPIDSDAVVRLELSHPLEADYDYIFHLKRQSVRGYYAEVDSIPEGRWYVRLEKFSGDANTLEWRLSGEVDFNSANTLLLQ